MKSSRHRISAIEPTDIGPSCLAFRARMLSRVISAIYDEALAPLGLKASQLNVLSALARRGPSAQTDLCSVLKMDKSTLSRNVERMRKRGWLTAHVDEDNRVHMVSLTPQGAKLLREAFPLWRMAQAEAARRMGEKGVAALGILMRRLRELENAAHEHQDARHPNGD